jgi:hypothetical protein
MNERFRKRLLLSLLAEKLGPEAFYGAMLELHEKKYGALPPHDQDYLDTLKAEQLKFEDEEAILRDRKAALRAHRKKLKRRR